MTLAKTATTITIGLTVFYVFYSNDRFIFLKNLDCTSSLSHASSGFKKMHPHLVNVTIGPMALVQVESNAKT
jgi:hypothetical protein